LESWPVPLFRVFPSERLRRTRTPAPGKLPYFQAISATFLRPPPSFDDRHPVRNGSAAIRHGMLPKSWTSDASRPVSTSSTSSTARASSTGRSSSRAVAASLSPTSSRSSSAERAAGHVPQVVCQRGAASEGIEDDSFRNTYAFRCVASGTPMDACCAASFVASTGARVHPSGCTRGTCVDGAPAGTLSDLARHCRCHCSLAVDGN